MGDLNILLTKVDDFAQAGYWGERIGAELTYGYHLSRLNAGKYDELLVEVIEFVAQRHRELGTITQGLVEEAEGQLQPIVEAAKKYEVLCAAHAHIDMNWMWRWDETVVITLDTFRTMLDLMEEYPEYTFSQSQASVYEIVEKHDPQMLAQIKKRVKEGRWEVTASAWVEADKNMPNGESMARHILYTKQYLSRLLDIAPESLNIAFEPDTFGHNANVPEILANGGVKYYYHCRGAQGDYLEQWKAPSGSSIIVYREPFWYNANIEPSLAYAIPQLCEQYGLTTWLKVYGVGDHGGGPTRRDIERIRDMATWPIFPRLRFGTFGEFFKAVEAVKDNLPVTQVEKNFIFTGCYTSQSRIKQANRVGEAALNEAETFASIAQTVGAPYPAEAFASAWQKVLFNQFHDILPGSCVIGTREHALGLFQEAMGIASSAKKRALIALSKQIDTSSLIPEEDISATRSEGAGVGFGVENFQISQSSVGAGKTRVFHVFNPSAHSRQELVEVLLWDWDYDLERLEWKDTAGNAVGHQVIDQGHYWGHTYVKVLVEAKVPACGYSTYAATESPVAKGEIIFPRDPRVEPIPDLTLENERLKAVLDPVNCNLVSLLNKDTGEELIGPSGARFRMIDEDIDRGTAWRIGRYQRIDNITQDAKVTKIERGLLRQSITYEVPVRSSKLRVTVILDKGSPKLDLVVECDWHEIGNREKGVPQLNYCVPLAYDCAKYKYDIPYGVVEREPMDRDVPANSWALAVNSSGKSQFAIVTDSKYGFRGVDNSLAVSLIRSSFDPDPYPENGKIHRFRLSLYPDLSEENHLAINRAYDANHPMTALSASRKAKGGSLPLNRSFLEVVSGAVLAAVKRPETEIEGSEILLRLYEAQGQSSEVVIDFAQPVKYAYFVDINEEMIGDSDILVQGRRATFTIAPYRTVSLKVGLQES
ncbi:MAG: alpha-mannosidase [Firmicutes bacterium]|nr:alpha-mannosidase [Bacillota bacterium]